MVDFNAKLHMWENATLDRHLDAIDRKEEHMATDLYVKIKVIVVNDEQDCAKECPFCDSGIYCQLFNSPLKLAKRCYECTDQEII